MKECARVCKRERTHEKNERMCACARVCARERERTHEKIELDEIQLKKLNRSVREGETAILCGRYIILYISPLVVPSRCDTFE